VVGSIPGQRYSPPSELTPEQAREWRKVVGSLPPEWFSGENLALLADYCRHIVFSRRAAQALDEIDRGQLLDEEDLKRFDRLSTIFERHTRTLASLATRMRLTQQSRYDALKAATHTRGAGAGVAAKRPWEFDGEDA